MLIVFLFLLVFPAFAFSQFLSYDAIRMRVPGRCMSGDYDCGLGQCVPISQFRDGKPDCLDGSDEWCFIGQVSCGPVYCADYKDALPCIVYPKCDGSSKQLPWCTASKEKLCADKRAFPCKGYGECVLWEWLLDGKKDCIDGSDEDENYVMPLEHAYRCSRNKTGLTLPKPIPPPPEDHPSLHVQGCCFCPNTMGGPPGIMPPSEAPDVLTTPKYPFITMPAYEKTHPPLSNFPLFPTEDSGGDGEFFPSGVEISRVTHPTVIPTIPEESDEFFQPIVSTSNPTQSHTFRVLTIPSIVNTPEPPPIVPTTLPPITAAPNNNNWPIPILTSTPESHHQGPLPPITYPHTKIPPINPETDIVITRPLSSGNGQSNGPHSVEEEETPGYNEYGTIEKETNGGIPGGVETLIPLFPGNVQTTRKPFVIPSFYTKSTPAYVSATTPKIDKNMPTLIPNTEQEEYVQTQVPPAGVTNEATTHKEGWIEEEGNESVKTTTITPNGTTVTKLVKTTTAKSKVIHVGPNGVIEEEEEEEEENQTKTTMTNGVESGNVIHIGPTESNGGKTTVNTTTSSGKSTETTETTRKTTTMKSSGDPEADSCLANMIGNEDMSHVMCDCENGKFKTESGECAETLSLMNVKIQVNKVCGLDNVSFEDKQKIIHQKISETVKHPACIQNLNPGGSVIATIKCEDCSLEEVTHSLNTKSINEAGTINVTAESLGQDLCYNNDYNHCHIYAECVVDTEGLRYACRCKKGTTDISDGYGRKCDGFPEESDCIMVFGICLIVWLLFLLGVFMLTLLCCLICFTLCKDRCCRNIAIHPMSVDGLQTVIIGPNASKGGEDQQKMPHMRQIFAESLRHSAKGSSSVASAFALTDFRRKKVSKAPDMSQVIEEVNEVPSTPIRDADSASLPKVSSLAKMSTHTANSEPATPGVIETPILEKNSSSVSLVSANENAPQLPSLPLPLPVPITTSPSTTNLEESGAAPPIEQRKTPEPERPSSSHSIGVQPTIWETYRVLGQQYSKSDLTERKGSVDSLEAMFDARVAETARTGRTNKSDNSPIMFTAKPHDDTEKNTSVAMQPVADTSEVVTAPPEDEKEQIEKNLEDAKENKTKETDNKLADMIGVTSFHAKEPIPPTSEELEKAEVTDTDKSTSISLEKSLEAALLIEMAKQGIELPLSPKSPVPPIENFAKRVEPVESTTDSEMVPVTPKKPESRKSSAKSIASGRKSNIPSTSNSRAGSGRKMAKMEDYEKEVDDTEVFIPKGVLLKKPTLRRTSATRDGTTDESDPEIAFFKRLERIQKDAVDRNHPVYPSRRYTRRRRPERTLSSISEKSAEIAAEAALEYPIDTSISCPPTTRSLLELKPPMPRYYFRRKVYEATGETSDVDIPKLKAGKVPEPISSPEIPDVTRQRSRENLYKTDIDDLPETLVSSRSIIRKNGTSKKPKSSSVSSSRLGSKATTPRNGDETASHTSRSTRHSVISRKIAIRRQELKAVSGHDRLNRSKVGQPHVIRGSRSVSDLRQRPWDITQSKERPDRSTSFLPPIGPTRMTRTAATSPNHRNRRSDSHYSLVSLPIAHSPTSFWSSPYFNPSEDSRKPPKEDLWWNPNNKRL